jgi:predicted transcriptional regulator
VHKLDLNEDSALVLQQIEEAGEEDIDNLNESLRFGRGRLTHILKNLQHKGLINIRGEWITLSAKGRKVSRLIWPELKYIRY